VPEKTFFGAANKFQVNSPRGVKQRPVDSEKQLRSAPWSQIRKTVERSRNVLYHLHTHTYAMAGQRSPETLTEKAVGVS